MFRSDTPGIFWNIGTDLRMPLTNRMLRVPESGSVFRNSSGTLEQFPAIPVFWNKTGTISEQVTVWYKETCLVLFR